MSVFNACGFILKMVKIVHFMLCVFYYDNILKFLRYILDIEPTGLADVLPLGKGGTENSTQIFSSAPNG